MLKNINKYTPTASTEDFQEESLNDQEVGAADLATAETEGTVVEPTGSKPILMKSAPPQPLMQKLQPT